MIVETIEKGISKSSKVFYQYSLGQTSRIDGEVKRRTILCLGSKKLLEKQENRKAVLEILKSGVEVGL